MIGENKAEGSFRPGTRLLGWRAENQPCEKHTEKNMAKGVTTVRTCIRIIFWNVNQFLVFLFTKAFYYSVSGWIVWQVEKTTSLLLASVLEAKASEKLVEFGAWSKREACWLSSWESIAQTRMKGGVGEEARRGCTLVCPHQWVLPLGHLPWLCRNGKGKPQALHRLEGICALFPGRESGRLQDALQLKAAAGFPHSKVMQN